MREIGLQNCSEMFTFVQMFLAGSNNLDALGWWHRTHKVKKEKNKTEKNPQTSFYLFCCNEIFLAC